MSRSGRRFAGLSRAPVGGVAALGLALTLALAAGPLPVRAQDGPAGDAPPPSASTPAIVPAPSIAPADLPMPDELPVPPEPTAADPAVASPGTMTMRGPDTMLADKLGAVRVFGPDDEEVGDVSDIILTHDGRVQALVVGVGGLLGLGEKPVAILYEHLSVRPVADGEEGEIEFVTDLDRQALKDAPPYSARPGDAGGGG